MCQSPPGRAVALYLLLVRLVGRLALDACHGRPLERWCCHCAVVNSLDQRRSSWLAFFWPAFALLLWACGCLGGLIPQVSLPRGEVKASPPSAAWQWWTPRAARVSSWHILLVCRIEASCMRQRPSPEKWIGHSVFSPERSWT